MDISNLMGTYKDIVSEFTEEKIRQRYCNIIERANSFIIAYGFQDTAYVNDNNVMAMIMDYFSDISRLKKFHGISKVNKLKILSYTAYWALRRKIIQISCNDALASSTYINEKFILTYLLDELTSGFSEELIPKDGHYGDFVNLLYYCLKYRNYDPQNIELMLMSYIAAFSLLSNATGIDVSNYSIHLDNEEE